MTAATKNILNGIASISQENRHLARGALRRLLDKKIYASMPQDAEEFIAVCDGLVNTGQWTPFWLVTQWIKRREAYDKKYFTLYESWLFGRIDSWGACDVFCYRVLNPMVEKHPEFFGNNVLEWARSERVYVRRAAAVCLLHSSQSFFVNVEFSKVKTICDMLKSDKHIHIQKGIGWLLKYAYLSYPEEVMQYLRDNINILSRTAFRYGLEKADAGVREAFMRL